MGEVRVLGNQDVPAVRRLLDLRPVDNVLIASRVQAHGVERSHLGNDLLGYWEDGELTSFLSDGYNLHPINAGPAALAAFARRLEHRRCASIVGVRDEAMGLYEALAATNYTQWGAPREIRDHQRVMVIDGPPLVQPDPAVQVATTRLLDSYHAASVAMYTEEVGVAPLDSRGAYRTHVASLLMKGHAFCVQRAGQVVFKADIVATAGTLCQVGGVWLAPALRGHGWSKPLMAAVVARCQERYPVVTLYVNRHNIPAVKCYLVVGFRQVSECATILY